MGPNNNQTKMFNITICGHPVGENDEMIAQVLRPPPPLPIVDIEYRADVEI